MSNPDNKTSLFQFLAEKDNYFKCNLYQDVIATKLDQVVILHSSDPTSIDITDITPSDHEEADSRIYLHCLHASNIGLKNIMIVTVDSDVVVLAVHLFVKLNLEYLWVKFGVGKHIKFIAVHEIVSALTPQYCSGILFFHAFTGCDTVSSFENHGKKSAWMTWKRFPQISETFAKLSTASELNMEDCREIESFVIEMYHKGLTGKNIDVARKNLVFGKACPPDKLPPTSAALRNHSLRALHQAGHIWGQSLVKNQRLQDRHDFGWKNNASGAWVPFWSHLPPASQSDINKNCGCKNKICKGNCNCRRLRMNCTTLRVCKAQCKVESQN